MSATTAPHREIRLHPPRSGSNGYARKQRYAELLKKHSVPVRSKVNRDAWTSIKNKRRCTLIDKSIQEALTSSERAELERLQQQAEAYFDEVAPPPIEGARSLHAQLLKRKAEAEDD